MKNTAAGCSRETKEPMTEMHIPDSGADLRIYRERTAAMLRRYCRLSVELGRLPSMLGGEFFRSNVTSYRIHSFEDVVIFVHDMERCVERLDHFSQQLLARVVMEEHTRGGAAKLLGVARKTVERRYPEALDKLTGILLERNLLERIPDKFANNGGHCADGRTKLPPLSPVSELPPKKPAGSVRCQEGETRDSRVIYSIHRK